MTKPTFLCSRPLKELFSRQFENWQKRTHADLSRLADLCGVTPSYLAHVQRYGRVPGKPVLLLLALNFELSSPKEIFEAAGLKDPWPYDAGISLGAGNRNDPGFISLRVDMEGFTKSLRDLIRAEIRPQSIFELTRGRTLRVGLNLGQHFLCGQSRDGLRLEGLFPELVRLLLVSLQCPYEIKAIDYRQALEKLPAGELDLYGPLYSTPKRLGKALYSDSFCHVNVGAVWRLKAVASIPNLPKPRNAEEFVGRGYDVAVLRDSATHDFAVTQLGLPESRLIVCDSPVETLERVTLKGIGRPAHLLLCDAPIALDLAKDHPTELEALFLDREKTLAAFENTIAVRPDWPQLQAFISDSLNFFRRERTLKDIFGRHLAKAYEAFIGVG